MNVLIATPCITADLRLLCEGLAERGHRLLNQDSPEYDGGHLEGGLDAYYRTLFAFYVETCGGKADVVIHSGKTRDESSAFLAGAAHVAGTPVLGLRQFYQSPAAFMEIGVRWFDTLPELLAALDEMTTTEPES